METLIPLGLLGLIIAGVTIAYPFLTEAVPCTPRPRPDQSASELDNAVEQVIKTIRDLDFDYDMGKIPPADYALQRKALIGMGVSLLIRLDDALAAEQAQDAELERRIAAYRAATQGREEPS